ncbi:MAG: DUF1848 domain-containing protein [Lachnospiraceae bacterium]|nr:DUF1848 domain-containing protein [Lachnospiraceae bacterium]
MILNTGSRTDIPAYYSDWFYNRIKAGYVLVRNPYYPSQITKYLLSPDVIDVMVFCTKNPFPMLGRLSLLSTFDTFWFVTITPYGAEIEPHVPPREQVIASFRQLSAEVGSRRMSWRYDPVLITEQYSIQYHIEQFQKMAEALSGYTEQCVISFIDLYEKTKRNFRGIRSVTKQEQEILTDAFSQIAKENGLQIHLCCENKSLVRENVDADGCMSKAVFEKALGCRLEVPKKKTARRECSCLLGADIGAYNTCGHGCLYCYANYDMETVAKNRKLHNASSPLLIGELSEQDVIKPAEQKLWKNGQLDIFDFFR